VLNSYTIRRARHDRFHTPRHQVTSGYAADQLGFTALHVAAQFGRDMLMELLVERGADLEARTAEGYAPEHVAAGAGQVAAIEWLIARGMDMSLDSPRGTALEIARSEGHAALVERLASLG